MGFFRTCSSDDLFLTDETSSFLAKKAEIAGIGTLAGGLLGGVGGGVVDGIQELEVNQVYFQQQTKLK